MKKYISYFGSNIFNFLLHLLYLFPVRKKRIMFISYFGKKYACNPRYIFEYMQSNYPGEFEMIWAFNEPKEFLYLTEQGVKICKCRRFKYYYYRLTSGVVVHNSLIGAEAPIRKQQLYIQTWHGSGAYKTHGLGNGAYKNTVKGKISCYELMVDKRIRKTFAKNGIVMASCEVGKQKTFVEAMGYHGRFVNGMPRIDILIHGNRQDLCKKVRKSLCIVGNKKLMLYAPTWRNNCCVSDFGIDYVKVRAALEQRFGGEWVILRRMHHNSVKGGLVLPEDVIDATSYPDMQELLVAADAVISDYSSTLWDFSFTGKPCFQYCPDLDEYQAKRGISTDIYKWGFPLAKSNDELESCILNFNQSVFETAMSNHHEMFGSLETGHAIEDICNIIFEYTREN